MRRTRVVLLAVAVSSGLAACELFFPLDGYAGRDAGSGGGSTGGSGGGSTGGGSVGGGGGSGGGTPIDAGPARGTLFCGEDGGSCIGGQQKCCTGRSSAAFWNSSDATCEVNDAELCPATAVWVECADSENCPSGQFCCFNGLDAGTFASTACAVTCGPSGPALCKADGGGACPGAQHCGGAFADFEGDRECVP